VPSSSFRAVGLPHIATPQSRSPSKQEIALPCVSVMVTMVFSYELAGGL
jgi:hypothetical protein